MNTDRPESPARAGAYLVLREGVQWRDVYRLVEGHCVTIGREASNRVVLADDQCSRRHCEIFHGSSGWIVRDLNSSNGTRVNGEPALDSVLLNDGDSIGIGQIDLLFTHDISKPLAPDDSSIERSTSLDVETSEQIRKAVEGDDDSSLTSSGDSSFADDPEILEQKTRSRFREPGAAGLHKEFARLYQLSAEMVTAREPRSLANTVLDGLFRFLTPDIGAILQLPEPVRIAERRLHPLALRTSRSVGMILRRIE